MPAAPRKYDCACLGIPADVSVTLSNDAQGRATLTIGGYDMADRRFINAFLEKFQARDMEPLSPSMADPINDFHTELS